MPVIEVDDPSQIHLVHASEKSSLTVSLKGGTITSWKIFNNELLYLSPTANTELDNDTPIRGGIPIVFPQFNNTLHADMPKHGFARFCTWSFAGQEKTEEGDIEALFMLKSNETTKKYWDQDFSLILQVTLGFSYLQTSLIIQNTDEEKTMGVHALFHNYMMTENIDSTVISGLRNINYTDSLTKTYQTDRSILVPIAHHIDRIYRRHVYDEELKRYRSEEQMTLGDGGNAEIVFKSLGCRDVVIWNPYGKVEFKDMPQDDWKKFVCVEFGNVMEKMNIAPGESQSISQRMVLKLLAAQPRAINASYAQQAVALMKEEANKKEQE